MTRLFIVLGLLACGMVLGTPVRAASETTAYPLALSANHRYLVDQNGAPFLMVGDSPQALIGDLSEADADYFFANRQAAGFNTQWINLLCNNYTGCRADGATFDGIPPFTSQGDLSTPNEAYFARVDRVLQLAANHGQLVLLDPIETGGWTKMAIDNGASKAYTYGKYLGQRYAGFRNIVWMSGNDYQDWGNEAVDVVIRSVAQGIKDGAPHHLQTLELNYKNSGSLDDARWAPLLSLDAAYTYFPTYAQVLKEYNRASIPVFMVEANYEGEKNHTDLGTPHILRRQEYWTMLSGATGQLYGNRYTWQFLDDWKSNIDVAGSNQMRHVIDLFAPRRWYDLVPDQSHKLVTDGYGTFASDGSLGGNDYLTAAKTDDGTLAIAYMPTLRKITVDLSSVAGPVNASWYDPSRGTLVAIAGSPFANSGTREFAPPGQNADGDGDWVLVLQSSGQVPPSTTTTTVSITPTAAPLPTPVTPAPPVPVAETVGPAPIAAESAFARFVQVSDAVPQSPLSVVSVAYPLPQTAGDTNILAIGWNDATSTIESVTDTAGNAYKVAAPMARGDGVSQAIYFAPGIAGGANSVTVTFSAAVPFADIRIAEYAGLHATEPFDTSASTAGNSADADSGAVVISTDNELIVGAGITTGAFTAAGAQFTVRTITKPDNDILEDRVVSAAGTYAATAPGTGNWVMQVATFR
jgi:Protein of unknown function (DUF4038)/Putative collagen-binding domain of a collagenase